MLSLQDILCYTLHMQRKQILHQIFQAITQNKWLGIDYLNKEGKQSSFWIGIRDIDIPKRLLNTEGFHVTNHTIADFDRLYIDSISEAHLIDESYYPVPQELKKRIAENPDSFQTLFGHIPNLKILDYLLECTKLNTTPYQEHYSLLEHFDESSLANGRYSLSEEQFKHLVHEFQAKSKKTISYKQTCWLCMNVLSIHTEKGLYVLAYKKLSLDVKKQELIAKDGTSICKRFNVGNIAEESIRRFLDEDDYSLLDDFDLNREEIKDAISRNIVFPREQVDDLPYIIPLSRDVSVDLKDEYAYIKNVMEDGTAAEPLKAFFGNLTKPPIRHKNYPLVLIHQKANLDQLLAMSNAIKYPLSYIQGPPGTGKTSTIFNTITTAFFNEKTVLFSSFNNHPIDGVCEALRSIQYKGKTVPFPLFRIGNKGKMLDSLNFWQKQYLALKDTPIYTDTLERNKGEEVEDSQKLMNLLKRYEARIELEERRDAIEQLLSTSINMTYKFDLEGRQLKQIDEAIAKFGEIKNEDALSLTYSSSDRLLKYLYYTSIKHIKRLGEPKNKDLLDIFLMKDDDEKRLKLFSDFLKNEDNIRRMLRVFPVIASTCISAQKIGTPAVYVDMTIIDEASQCDNAISLVPIIRGKQLMLVGDPQQLNPVIVMDAKDNEKLRSIYKVPAEYDYIQNSIYKTFLACDSVSKEILLSHHYRCAPQIITFNNKKYYNGRLSIETTSTETEPLLFKDIPDDTANLKNTAPQEAEEIVAYAKAHPEQNIGVITPFVRQKNLVEQELKERGVRNITCGTVHTFQGDEKDVILFSLAVTNKTGDRTYAWLNSNRELINVATSRAKKKLVVIGSEKEINRLHSQASQKPSPNCEKRVDDIFELKDYIKTKGQCEVTALSTSSRALGIRPYSTETEENFLKTLSHALDRVANGSGRYSIKKEVGIAAVFNREPVDPALFYSGRFDFVLFERGSDKMERALLAIELDGKEHREDESVKRRDRMKNEICQNHHLILIRVDNTYARRYHFIKAVLEDFFRRVIR